MARLISTVGQASRHGMMVRVECLHCRHVGLHRAMDLMRALGAGRAFTDIRFRCTRCGRRDAKALPLEIDRDRLPKTLVWTLTRLR